MRGRHSQHILLFVVVDSRISMITADRVATDLQKSVMYEKTDVMCDCCAITQ